MPMMSEAFRSLEDYRGPGRRGGGHVNIDDDSDAIIGGVVGGLCGVLMLFLFNLLVPLLSYLMHATL